MRRTLQIDVDDVGEFILHDGVKYRPEIGSKFPDGAFVAFSIPHPSSSDSYATVTYNGQSETWRPSGV